MKIDPQNQKEVTNESCLIISNVDCETNFITLIYNLNDKWIEWKIDCQNILILNSGVRVNVASQLKIGMIGNIIGIANRESELGVFCSSWLVQLWKPLHLTKQNWILNYQLEKPFLELTSDSVMCLWLRYRQFLNICACDWSVDTNHELSLVEIDIWIMSLLVWRSKSWVSSLSWYFFIWTQKWFLFGPRLSNKKDILLSSILRPCKEDGVILRRQNRLLVQLSTPPAARYTRLRFFRGNCFSTQEIKLGTRSTFLTKFLLPLLLRFSSKVYF